MSIFFPKIRKIYKTLMDFLAQADRHHVFMLASAVAFDLLLYQIPLLLLSLYLVHVTIGFDDIADYIKELFSEFMPPSSEAEQYVDSLVLEVSKLADHAGFFGIIGSVVLLWISTFAISSIRHSLNTIFGMDPAQSSILHKFKDILYVLMFTVLMIIYSYVVPIISLLESFFLDWIPESLDFIVSGVFIYSTSIITSLVLFFTLYTVIPDQKPARGVRRMSTIIGTIVLELSRFVFAWYLTGLSNYGRFYGTYAVIVSMAVWVYYSSLILLLSAEISVFYFNSRNAKEVAS